ncbi:MAG TPA: hypothetical protein VK129_08850, partial [Terriglobales bacterium]|nr:hypothetical protein [Terriglobales bacterium]
KSFPPASIAAPVSALNWYQILAEWLVPSGPPQGTRRLLSLKILPDAPATPAAKRCPVVPLTLKMP